MKSSPALVSENKRDYSPLRAPGEGETEGINTYTESALHAALKAYLAGPGDRFEVPTEGRIVDLVRAGGELVEVQTARLDKIAEKVLALARTRAVRVVYPVVAETRILRLDPGTGELLSERKSPKRGDFYSLFDELVRAPRLIAAKNVTVEVLLVRTRELRTRDGTGSWRRRGDRTLARELLEVLESRSLGSRKDWLGILPPGLSPPWDSAGLGEGLGIGSSRARKVLYSYWKAGLLEEAGRLGRRKLYIAVPARKRRPTP